MIRFFDNRAHYFVCDVVQIWFDFPYTCIRMLVDQLHFAWRHQPTTNVTISNRRHKITNCQCHFNIYIWPSHIPLSDSEATFVRTFSTVRRYTFNASLTTSDLWTVPPLPLVINIILSQQLGSLIAFDTQRVAFITVNRSKGYLLLGHLIAGARCVCDCCILVFIAFFDFISLIDRFCTWDWVY